MKTLLSYRGVNTLNEELKEEVKKFFKIKYLEYVGPGFTFYNKCFLLYQTDRGKLGIGFFYEFLMLSFVNEIPDGKFTFTYSDECGEFQSQLEHGQIFRNLEIGRASCRERV